MSNSDLGIAVIVFFVIIFIVITAVVAIVVPIVAVNKHYKNFVLVHSTALKNLRAINNKYTFNKIPYYSLSHSYDNPDFFKDISAEDYLIYWLISNQKNVKKAIYNTDANKELYDLYWKEVTEKCRFNKWDVNETPSNRDKLIRYEKRFFYDLKKSPTTKFEIYVKLTQTNIAGSYITHKSCVFPTNYILGLIKRINDKRGDFYNDKGIWDAKSRVERGKVSNKMRFAIYARDGYRCKMCGRYFGKYSKGLEIDHIIPIAKGGKTEMSNLQTLCHNCNYKKGDKIL